MGFLKDLIIGDVIESVVESIPNTVGGVLSAVDEHKKRQAELKSASESKPKENSSSESPKSVSFEAIRRVCECCGAPLELGNTCRYCGTEYQTILSEKMKFCKYCAAQIPEEAVICSRCGRQVEELRQAEPPRSTVPPPEPQQSMPASSAKPKNKWTALALCVLLGWCGGHKFYEGKVGMGILYLFTLGLFGIGALIDFIVLLFKPNPYFV